MVSWQSKVARKVFVAALQAQRFSASDGVAIGPDLSQDKLERYALRLRDQMEQLGSYAPLPGWAQVEECDAPVRGDWVVSERSEHDRVVLHLHGGGYCMGSPRTHRGIAAALARVARARVFLPDYRLAPEDPFPAALDDAVAAYRWLVEEEGVEPGRMAVTGDSAGGGLAVALLCEARDRGLDLPACYVGLSPWTDLAATGESMTTMDGVDPWLRADLVLPAAAAYAGSVPLEHPRVSPLYADLSGLPPMLVHAGTDEILYDDGRRLVERARDAGVDASFGAFEHMWHVFHAFPGLPETRWALREIGAFVRRHTASPTSRQTRGLDVERVSA